MIDLNSVTPVSNEPRKFRKTVVDRSGTERTYRTVDELVDLIASTGGEFVHPTNPEGKSAKELHSEVVELRASTKRRPQSPTPTDLYGQPDALRPSDFAEAGIAGDTLDMNSYVYAGATYEVAQLGNGLYNRCIYNDRISVEHIVSYQAYLEYLSNALETLKDAAPQHNASVESYYRGKVECEELESILADQQELEEAVTHAAYVRRDANRSAIEENAALRAELDSLKKSIPAKIASALKKASK